MSRPHPGRAIFPLLFLVAIGALVRTVSSTAAFGDLALDTDAYARLSLNWSNSGVFGHESSQGEVAPTAFRPPFYPWLLSWLVTDGKLWLTAVAVVHIALGISTVGLTYAIGRRLQSPFSWIAAIAVAVDPVLLRQSQLVMTETLATFLAALAWWLWLVAYRQVQELPVTCDNPHAQPEHNRTFIQWAALAAFGIVSGLSILARPTAAPWLAICCLGMLKIGCTCWKRRINDVVLVGLIATATVAPWTLRNLAQLGKPIWATTHGGYTFLLANNPSLYQHFAANGPTRDWNTSSFDRAWADRHTAGDPQQLLTEDYWLHRPATAITESTPQVARLDEVSDDRLAYRAAQATIGRHPGMFLASCFYRAGWLWALWPRTDSLTLAGIVIGLWYLMIYSLAVVGMVKIYQRRALRGWLVGLALVVSLTAVHAVFWSNMRMRAPATPCLMLLATAGLTRRLASRACGSTRQTQSVEK